MPQASTLESTPIQSLSNLNFHPAGAVTGIGSVPLRSPAAAVDFVEEVSPLIPFWPKPSQGFPCSNMVEQLVQPFKSLLKTGNGAFSGYIVREGKLNALVDFLVGGEVGLMSETAGGFFAFEKALEDGRFGSALAIKGQTTGALTLAMSLHYEGKPFIEVPELRAALSNYVARLAIWQVERLQKWGKPVILFVNEPYLATVKESHAEWAIGLLDTVVSAVKSTNAVVGVHSCAAPPLFTVLDKVHPHLVSFDASQDLEKFLKDDGARHYVRSGGSVAFGFAPIKFSNRNLNVMPHYLRWVMSIPKEISTRKLARNALVTVTCGLSGVDLKHARGVFELAHQLGDRLRKLAERELISE